MTWDEHDYDQEPKPWFSLRGSAIWKVAAILVGIQVLMGLIVVALSAWYAYERSLTLVEKTIRVRLDDLADEVERRAFMQPALDGNQDPTLRTLPKSLLIDMTTMFPDPITLVDENASVIRTLQPSPNAFDLDLEAGPLVVQLPDRLAWRIKRGKVVVRPDARTVRDNVTWAMAPILNGSGDVVGALVVKPLNNSIRREFDGTRRATLRAVIVVIFFSGFTALILGGFFTWQMVKPLRDVMQHVERIGAGDFSARLSASSEDEFGRLGKAINNMAAEVEASVDTLRETDKLRRQMIANFGHDLRTPLAAMLGYLEEAQRHLGNNNLDSTQEAVVTAEQQGHYLKKLIGDLFELSLLDSAHAPLRKEPIPLAELIHEAANRHRPALKKAEIGFELELPTTMPMIEADGVRLLRVLDNLMTNARHHTPAGGTLALRAEVDPDEIAIQVADSGCGMAPDVLEHIFDRYYSGTGARTRNIRGTGLGLPISSAIARAHGGTLTAESVLDEGSTFTLRLPLNGHQPVLDEEDMLIGD